MKSICTDCRRRSLTPSAKARPPLGANHPAQRRIENSSSNSVADTLLFFSIPPLPNHQINLPRGDLSAPNTSPNGIARNLTRSTGSWHQNVGAIAPRMHGRTHSATLHPITAPFWLPSASNSARPHANRIPLSDSKKPLLYNATPSTNTYATNYAIRTPSRLPRSLRLSARQQTTV